MQGQLADVLYRKALRIGTDTRDAQGVGALVNLQSNDATKVYLLAVFFHMLWNAPLQVGGHLSLSSSTVATVSQDRRGRASPGVVVDEHWLLLFVWPAVAYLPGYLHYRPHLPVNSLPSGPPQGCMLCLTLPTT